MHASGMMHMLHALSLTPEQKKPSVSSMTLLWYESKQESIELHYGCCPAPPTIAQTGPLHTASEPFRLFNM
jgi:hypothetical protein